MKRLTLLTLLASALVTAPLHSEPTPVDALLPAASACAPSRVESVALAQMGQPQGPTPSGGQGQGGGLAIVQDLSKEYRGELRVARSGELGGARLEVRLPAVS